MKQIEFVEGSTHIAIVGTYNRVLAIVRMGENMEERIKLAINNSFEHVENIDLDKGLVWCSMRSYGNFHEPRVHPPMHKETIKFEQVKEY